LVSSPILGPRKNLCYYQTAAGLLTWGALSDERTGLSFTVAGGSRQRSLSSAGLMTIFYCLTLSDSRLPSPLNFRVRVKVTLRQAVYRQSVRLGIQPFEDHNRRIFPTEPLRL
jgi:hypothetical protein